MRNQQSEIAYVMLWANTTDMYWTPYQGHSAEYDFIEFKSNPYVLFNGAFSNIYNF